MSSIALRFLILFVLYGVVAGVSYWLSWRLRFGFYPGLDGLPGRFAEKWVVQGFGIVTLKLLCLYALGQFTGLIRFFRLPDAIRLFAGSSLASGICLLVWVLSSYRYVPPGSVLLVDFVIFTFLATGVRVAIRVIDERRKGFFRRGRKPDRIAIVGAGQAGSALFTELSSRPNLRMRPVVFFDDAADKHGRQLHGLPIAGPPEQIPSYHTTHDLDKVILALPKASTQRVREIVSLLKRNGVPVETVPSVEELMGGEYRTALTRAVHIEDLLYRDPVQTNVDELKQFIRGRRVLVTGAGGSIGRELSLQLSNLAPKRLILVDRCESVLFLTEKKIRDSGSEVDMDIRVADVAYAEALLTETRPEILFHAAAHKHVGMMERQPAEAFRNNVVATLDLARQAIHCGVAHFCLISTDKAVYPSSVMGATKRLSELAVDALMRQQNQVVTHSSIVRFGNVIGSSGSVIPIFEEQIDTGGPVTVTHPEMTRYFMTIPEAVGLVLQATVFSAGDALYMLDMGAPVKIDAVARDLIRLKGFEPEVEIPIIYTGIREGEKLHEILQREDERAETTAHPKIVRLAPTRAASISPDVFFAEIDSVARELPLLEASRAKIRIFDLLESFRDTD